MYSNSYWSSSSYSDELSFSYFDFGFSFVGFFSVSDSVSTLLGKDFYTLKCAAAEGRKSISTKSLSEELTVD